MPWRFVPTQRSVRLHPGQSTLAFYTAENRCDRAVTGVSTYNVAPQQAGQYFNKIQCFCFEVRARRCLVKGRGGGRGAGPGRARESGAAGWPPGGDTARCACGWRHTPP